MSGLTEEVKKIDLAHEKAEEQKSMISTTQIIAGSTMFVGAGLAFIPVVGPILAAATVFTGYGLVTQGIMSKIIQKEMND